MNEQAVPAGSGGYIFAFSISRKWVRTALLCAVAAGVVVTVLANAEGTFRIPLGIALVVLAVTILGAYARNTSGRQQKPDGTVPTRAASHRRVVLGGIRSNRSLASELALLADLHARGSLTTEEFTAAKHRILGT